ncbi:ankyrin-2 isoform X2 [Gambusia affinis]|uniref:ankyrin-2 isoform X2 n=1 Tax=Gambusia affinis TaxID=33528 RepID=UPI001CDCDD25|nr:ankyrin-2 isoform X2 [Gambusia affinis]
MKLFVFEDDESESTETFSLRTNQPLDPATLASPDILSDISDVRISAVFPIDVYEERARAVVLVEKESFAAVEHFKDRSEKNGEIQKENLIYSTMSVKERTAMVSKVNTDMEENFEPSVRHSSQEDLVQDTSGQGTTLQTALHSKQRPPNIKKPIRKKLRERELSRCSSSEGELERVSSEESLDSEFILEENFSASSVVQPPVSPLIIETPIGSIKDKVKALQTKVEQQDMQKAKQGVACAEKSSIIPMKQDNVMPELPQVPKSPKSPRSQTERLEEIMSVKDLMKAFQTGQDPSKCKSGLFEHKAPLSSHSETSKYKLTDTEETLGTEQSPTYEIPVIFSQHEDVNKMEKMDMRDEQVSSITKTTEKTLLISERPSNGKTVKFADTVQYDFGNDSPLVECRNRELQEKETLSVKDRMKIFQTEQDFPQNTTGLSQHKGIASSSTHFVSESESQDHAQSLMVLSPQGDPIIHDSTEDQTANFVRREAEEVVVSGGSLFGKTVPHPDSVKSETVRICSPGEGQGKPTVSVKELMKTFQDPSVEHGRIKTNDVAAPQTQKDIPTLTSVHQTVNKENKSKNESQQSSDVTYFRNTDENMERIDSNDKNISLKKEASDLSEKSPGKMQLDGSFLSTFGDLSEETQISPDRRTSEDFSADIKAELEENSEYQLFRQTQTVSDVKYQQLVLEGDESPGDFDSPCFVGDISSGLAGRSKYENLTESSEKSVDSSCSSSGEMQTSDTHQRRDEKTFSRSISETKEEKNILGADEADILADYESKMLYRQIDMEEKEAIIREPGLPDIQTEKKTSYQASAAEKDMQGTLLLMGKDFHQCPQIKSFETHKIDQECQETDVHKEIDEDTLASIANGNKKTLMGERAQVLENDNIIMGAGDKRKSELEKDRTSETLKDLSTNFSVSDGKFFPYKDKKTCQIKEDQDGESSASESTTQAKGHSTLIREYKREGARLQQSDTTKNVSGMFSHLSSDVHEYIKEPVERKSHLEDVLHENVKEVKLSRDHSEEQIEKKKNSETAVISPKEERMISVLETPCQQIHTERTIYPEHSVSEKNMTGMLSHLSSDLEDYLKEKPVMRQSHSEEDLINDQCKEKKLVRDFSNDKLCREENLETHVVQVKEQIVFETQFEEVCDKRKGSPEKPVIEKDMSGMLSHLSSDLDEYVREIPVTRQSLPEEDLDLVSESCKEIKLARDDLEDKTEENVNVQTDQVVVNEETKTSDLEAKIEQVYMERRGSPIKPAIEKEMSGMLSHLSSDMNEYIIQKPLTSQSHLEEDLINETCKEIKLARGDSEDKTEKIENLETEPDVIKEQTQTSVFENEFKQVYVERKGSPQNPTIIKNMTGMLSHLSSDLDEHFKQIPVTRQSHPEEDLVSESCKEIKLSRDDSKDRTQKMENAQFDTAVVKEQTKTSVSEAQFEKIYLENKESPQKQIIMKDMSGMLSHLSSDLDEHVKQIPLTRQSLPEEYLVSESFKEIKLARDYSEDNSEKMENAQTDPAVVNEQTKPSVSDAQFEQVYFERYGRSQKSVIERDMSGMLSHLSSDLDEHFKQIPVTRQSHPEEDLVNESCNETKLAKDNSEDKPGEEENVKVDPAVIKEQTKPSVSEAQFEQLYVKKKESPQKPVIMKDMSSMLSHLSSDLDEYVKQIPVSLQNLPEEGVVNESCTEIKLSRDDSEDKIEKMENGQIGPAIVKEQTKPSASEPQFEQVYMERKGRSQKPVIEKDISGMLSHLSCDLDEYFKQIPVTRPSHPEEDLVNESCKETKVAKHDSENKPGEEEIVQADPNVVKEQTETSVSEAQFEQVYMERKGRSQKPVIEKDMSGMLSHLSCDLDEYFKQIPVTRQSLPEEDLVNESCKETKLAKDDSEDKPGEEENVKVDPAVIKKQIKPSVSEAQFEQVYMERKGISQKPLIEKDMSGMLSHLSCDLDEHFKQIPVTRQSHPEEDLVSESCKETKLVKDDSEDKPREEENVQADPAVVQELTQSSVSEVQFEQVSMERKGSQKKPVIVKDMSGMLSHLSCDLDEHFKQIPVTRQSHPEEDLVSESCKETKLVKDDSEDKPGEEEKVQADPAVVQELTQSSVSEAQFEQVSMERKGSQKKPVIEKDMSGMLSHLICNLDEYFKHKPVISQSQLEEDLVSESCKEVKLARDVSEDKVSVDQNLQTHVVGDKEHTQASVLETHFDQVDVVRKGTPKKPVTEKDMSAMLSHLRTDIDEYVSKGPVIKSISDEDLVSESCKEIKLARDNLEEQIRERKNIQLAAFGVKQKQQSSDLESEFEQVCIERKGSPQKQVTEKDMSSILSVLSSDLDENDKQMPLTRQSNSEEDLVSESCKEIKLPRDNLEDNLSFAASSHLNIQGSFQLSSTHSTLKRPSDLDTLQTQGFDDSDQEPCHQDSLEASPLMEDRSSKKSPDSIEPSPTKESPCQDSLEGSPTQPKEQQFQMPVQTAVYEDYASQLKACFASDKAIHTDESGNTTQESITAIPQVDGKVRIDQSPKSTHEVTGFSVWSNEGVHTLIRQDSLGSNDSENDTTNKQHTPEEEMFKIAVKIKTFDEMEHESKMKKDKLVNAPSLSDESAVDLKYDPATKASLTDVLHQSSEKQVAESSNQPVEDSLCVITSQKEEPERSVSMLQVAEIHKDMTEGVSSQEAKAHFPCTVRNEHTLASGFANESVLTHDSEFNNKPQDYGTIEVEDVTLCCSYDNVTLKEHTEGEQQVPLDALEDTKKPEKIFVQTPGGEKSPSPFQFQEGKLFEMTRGGAIDMTRRTFDEEEESYLFFHVGEHPVEEAVLETTVSDTTLQRSPKSQVTPDVCGVNSSPESKSTTKPSLEKSKLEKSLQNVDLCSFTDTKLASPNASKTFTDISTEAESLKNLGLVYLDSTIADLQLDTSAESEKNSLDSSSSDDDELDEDEDQCSVIEMRYHQHSPRPLDFKETPKDRKDISVREPQLSELVQVREAGEILTFSRRTRSEDNTTKAFGKEGRSYSESSQPSNILTIHSSKPTTIIQEKALADWISSSSPPINETSVRSSLETDEMSSTSHMSSDSVIFTYDIPASQSSDSDSSQLPVVHPSCGTEDVFESRPAWDDTVETQMQRIGDDQTPEFTSADWQDDTDRKEETLAIIADLLGFSWTELARELEFSEDDVQQVRTENPNSLQEQSHALLQRWVEREGKHATEDSLIKRLTKINRMDIVHLIETQMNKSVQEQTSRTYAEIEKTLDHSEVSVALSSVQEDTDSPRIVRRVESDRRPPPAVSEEDLSVASLLDIPSWAEPAGQTHSESMHGDLLEEPEIPHELNPNLWTSEDVITQESTSHSDEQVSSSTFKTNIAQAPKHNVDMGQIQGMQTETLLLTHDSNTAMITSHNEPVLDIVNTECDITSTSQSSFPQGKYNESDSETLESQENLDSVLTIKSLNSSPTSQKSGSPQFDQMFSDLKEIKLKLAPEKHDSHASESSDSSPDEKEAYIYTELSPEEEYPTEKVDEVSVFPVPQLTEGIVNVGQCLDTKHAPESDSDIHQESNSSTEAPSIPEVHQRFGEEIQEQSFGHFQYCQSIQSLTDTFASSRDILEKNQNNFNRKNLMTNTYSNCEGQCLPTQSLEPRGTTEETSAEGNQDQCLWEGTSTKTISTYPVSDFTPDIATSSRHFSFDELIPYPSSRSVEKLSDENGYEYFAPESPIFKLKTETSSSGSDEEYTNQLEAADISSASGTHTRTPLRIADGSQCRKDSPNLEYSDMESFFDCKQVVSDLSENELDAPETIGSAGPAQSQVDTETQEKAKQKIIPSSGSEDYEDALLVHESYNQELEESRESLHHSETSDEEFTLCKTSLPSGTYYTDKSLQRVDEGAHLPTQSVTEEKYRDENGHLVVKRVTRKVVRKCASVNGEEIPSEGASQDSLTVADEDGYSRMGKRTVLKSVGDHTEVTFLKSEGFLSSRQEKVDSEKKTVVEAEKTTTSQGDPSLASKLPSAQNYSKQGPHV